MILLQVIISIYSWYEIMPLYGSQMNGTSLNQKL